MKGRFGLELSRRTWYIHPELQKIKTFTKDAGFCSNTINQIIQDKQKEWIEREGLVCFLSTDELNYKTYQRKDGLINTNICAITKIKRNIWFSNNKGISCYVTNKGCFITMTTLTMFRQEVFKQLCHKARMDRFISVLSMVCCFNPDITMNEQPAPAEVVTEMKILGRLSIWKTMT